MRNRHRLTRFTPSNSTVSSTNVELENGSRCQKVLTGDNVLLWGCQKFCHGGEPWLPQRHDMLGQIGGRPFQGETREIKKNRRPPGRFQGCFLQSRDQHSHHLLIFTKNIFAGFVRWRKSCDVINLPKEAAPPSAGAPPSQIHFVSPCTDDKLRVTMEQMVFLQALLY